MTGPDPTTRAASAETTVAEAVWRALDLDRAIRDAQERVRYPSLSLCVIDAVYSIGVRYAQVEAVVERYCARYRVEAETCGGQLPLPRDQDAISALAARIDATGPERFAAEVLLNKGRTSTRNGILKAVAVRRFCAGLSAHKVEYLQDVPAAAANKRLADDIKCIPGQRSGISFVYFLMLAGCEDFVKPDRMVRRFLESVLQRTVGIDECQMLLAGAVAELRPRFPGVTPLLLDSVIWEHERSIRRGGGHPQESPCRRQKR